MKKYCFTKCFKTKIQKFWEGILNILIAALIVIGVMLFIFILLGIFGLIGQAIYVYLNGSLIGWEIGILDSGALTLLSLALTITFIFLGYKIIEGIWWLSNSMFRGARHMAMSAIGKEKFQCKIFEECKG